MEGFPRINFMTAISILGAAQGIFLAGILLFRKSNTIANRVLAVTMFAFSISIFSVAYYAHELYRDFPHFIGVTSYFPFLYGPLLFLYARIIISGKNIFKRKYFLHFIPFFLFVLYTVPFYCRSGTYKIYFMEQLGQNLRLDILIIDRLKVIHGLVYVFFTIKLVQQHRNNLKNSFSNIDRINLAWLKNLTIVIVGVWGLVAIMHALEISGIHLYKNIDSMISITMAVAIYAIGYLGLRQPEIFSPQIMASPYNLGKTAKYTKSGLTPEKAEAYLKNLVVIMEKEKPFTNLNLTLKELADKLSISSHNLSEVINLHVQQSFYDFINNYRVEEAKKMLADPKSQNMTILAIAFDVGFNSKSSFNSIFKKHTRMTPSEYKRKTNKKSII